MSATKLPFPDECLDVVVSIGRIHHIPDVEQAIDEICCVLRLEGIFKAWSITGTPTNIMRLSRSIAGIQFDDEERHKGSV